MADKFGWQKANRRDAARRPGGSHHVKAKPLPATMPFGKYRGRSLSEIPTDYLEWVIREVPNLRGLTRMAIEGVLHRAKLDQAEPWIEDTLREEDIPY